MDRTAAANGRGGPGARAAGSRRATGRLLPAGLALLTLLAAGCSDDSSPLNVVPSTPSASRAVGGAEQTATVATALPESLSVRIEDEYGNPVPDVEVVFSTASGAGAVSPSTDTTDLRGEVTAEWTLATTAGADTVLATVEGLEARRFSAVATPGPPAALETAGGDGQAGAAGSELDDPLVVQVVDVYGNGVPNASVEWTTVDGGGAPEPVSSVSDSVGLAETRYTLGTTVGMESVEAHLPGLDRDTFTVQAGEPNNLTIHGAYLTQSAQPYDGSVPLVAGRDGLLRVFAVADSTNLYTPDVRVRFYDTGELIQTDTIPAPRLAVPTEPDESRLDASWNIEVPGSLVQPGLEIAIDVDPSNEVYEMDESDNALPADGSPGAQEVWVAPEFRVRFVPVHVPAEATTGDVDEQNKGTYLVQAEKMFPLPGTDADVRSTFTTSAAGTSTREQWETILEEVNTLRVDEGSDRHYYGVIGYSATNPGLCGLGYIGTPTAIGIDDSVCGAMTAAHEWGHNWGRKHAPCGDPANPDPDYPYADASIGIWGVDVETGDLKSPDDHSDIMSYCSPEWASDYTYEGVLEFRDTAAAASAAFAAARERSLVVWGRTAPDGLVLEPAFETTTRPALPQRDGPYRVEGLAADGSELFSLSFAGTPVEGAADRHRHFAFAVPLRMIDPGELDRIRLTAPGRTAAEVRRPPAAASLLPRLDAVRADPARARVDWNAGAFPVAIVRDAATGSIVAFGRGGSAVVRTGAAELDITLAAGVGTVERRVSVR